MNLSWGTCVHLLRFLIGLPSSQTIEWYLVVESGKRVRAVRKAAKITQEKAAERAGLNSKYLGQIERAENDPLSKQF